VRGTAAFLLPLLSLGAIAIREWRSKKHAGGEMAKNCRESTSFRRFSGAISSLTSRRGL
jgi:hypothetical protein